MESIDTKLAQRVWNRVNGGWESSLDRTALTALLSQELTDAAVCIHLARRLGGRGGDLLKLAQQCQQNAGCLRGICAIATGKSPVTGVPAPADEPAQSALRKCYVNSLRRMREYEDLSQDGDYGPVFQKMATAMQNQCAALLEIIGKLAS